MSIIQEALKKVQGDYARGKISPTKVKIKQGPILPNPYKRNVFQFFRMNKKLTPMRLTLISSIIIVFISSLIIIGFGLKLFLLFTETTGKKKIEETPLGEVAAPLAAIPESPSQIQTAPEIKTSPAIPARNIPSYDVADMRPPNFVLNGVMYLDGKAQAIINGYMLEEGDVLNGATVMLIDKDYVLLNINDSKIKVKLNK